jgi:hypothetical protein
MWCHIRVTRKSSISTKSNLCTDRKCHFVSIFEKWVKKPVKHGVVLFSPSAPSSLFSISYVTFATLYINVCLVSIDYDSLCRGDSDFRTRSKIESSREGHFCGCNTGDAANCHRSTDFESLVRALTTFCYMIPGSIYRRLSRQSKLTLQKVS